MTDINHLEESMTGSVDTHGPQAAEAPPPRERFQVVVVDPPWSRNPVVEDICALPIQDLVHDDCVLWLWAPNNRISDAGRILDAWGFEQRTMLTWVKDRTASSGSWILLDKTEQCILAVRGNPMINIMNQTTVLEAPRQEAKPEEFYKMVEAMCPGNKVELFGQRCRDGWKTGCPNGTPSDKEPKAA